MIHCTVSLPFVPLGLQQWQHSLLCKLRWRGRKGNDNCSLVAASRRARDLTSSRSSRSLPLMASVAIKQRGISTSLSPVPRRMNPISPTSPRASGAL